MMTVWKFLVPPEKEFFIRMPKGSKLLTFAIQHGEKDASWIPEDVEVPTLWILTDPDAPRVKRLFRLMGTGHEDSERLKNAAFIGSVIMQRGKLVFHLFDLGEQYQ